MIFEGLLKKRKLSSKFTSYFTNSVMLMNLNVEENVFISLQTLARLNILTLFYNTKNLNNNYNLVKYGNECFKKRGASSC